MGVALAAILVGMADRERMFDAWAPGYDDEVSANAGFPFEGYDRTLAEVERLADVPSPARVLEIGVGTGTLTARLARPGREVVGVDFSAAMLERARAKAPGARLLRLDVLGAWPRELDGQRFDRIVSTYAFHEFPDERKLALLHGLRASRLAPSGVVVIGDIAFASVAERQRQRARWRDAWDDEDYWIVEDIVPRLRGDGWQVAFTPTSFCAGVFALTRAARQEGS